jgi:hypothetical protein
MVSDSFNDKEWPIVRGIYTFSPSDQFEAVKRRAMNTAVNRCKNFLPVLLNVFERLPPCGV